MFDKIKLLVCSLEIHVYASVSNKRRILLASLLSGLADAKTLLTHKWYPKTYKKYEISCEVRTFCLSLHKIVCLRQNEA